MADTEIDKLIASLETTAERTGVRSQVEDELRGTYKPASQRGGRLPTFYRAEVNAILADERTLREICETWGVSMDTISRVKQLGRFSGVPYIARDEVDRTLAYNGMRIQKTMKDMQADYHRTNPRRYRKGRPFSSGRPTLTDEDKLGIALDERPLKEVAAHWQISDTYVKKIKRDLVMTIHKDKTLSPELVQSILADTREVTAIASAFKIPSALIIEIKAGRYA